MAVDMFGNEVRERTRADRAETWRCERCAKPCTNWHQRHLYTVETEGKGKVVCTPCYRWLKRTLAKYTNAGW